MKKRYTLLLFTISFSIFLISQILIDNPNIWASFSQKKTHPEQYYNNIFKEVILGQDREISTNLSALKSDIVILNFWASWCKPCHFELNSLSKLRKKYDNKELAILSINGDKMSEAKKVQKMIETKGINFPVFNDSNGAFFEKFLVDSVPFSLVYYKGKIIEVVKGKRDFFSKKEILKLENLLSSTF